MAKLHVFNFSGRSVFLVFVRLPEGRQATLDYFQTLWNFPQPWVPGPPPVAADQSQENPDLPSFPPGTQMALVRQMMLFDNQGNLAVSPITESVQIRVYREITAARSSMTCPAAAKSPDSGQDFFEIRISRPLLFSGRQGGLRATTRDEIELPTFQTIGGIRLANPPNRHGSTRRRFRPSCSCVSIAILAEGINSFNSLDSLLKPSRLQQETRDVNYGPRYWSESNALWWKENRYDWGLLNGYWKAVP